MTIECEENKKNELLETVSTLQKIRRFYGKVIGNQLPVHFTLFFTAARKYFQESGTVR